MFYSAHIIILSSRKVGFYMVMVCKNHVKNVLFALDVPHVEISKLYKSPCIFCKQDANIKIFYSVPTMYKIRKLNNIHKHE